MNAGRIYCYLLIALVAMSAMCVPYRLFAKGSPPIELAPSGAWQVDYANDSCALQRGFGGPGNEVRLEFRRFAPGDGFRITVAGKGIGLQDSDTRVVYEPDEKTFRPQFLYHVDFEGGMEGLAFWDTLMATDDKKKHRSGDFKWPHEQRDAREAEIAAVRMEKSFGPAVRLQTGSLAAPMRALRDCTDDLATHWGLDPVVQRALSRSVALKNDRSLINLLRSARSGHAGNFTQVRLLIVVDAAGKATDCHMQISANHFEGASSSCQDLAKSLIFEPALDAASKPVASFYENILTAIARSG